MKIINLNRFDFYQMTTFKFLDHLKQVISLDKRNIRQLKM